MKRCITILVLCFTLLCIIFFLFVCHSDKEKNAKELVQFKYDSYNNLSEKFIGNYEDRKVFYVGIDNLFINNTRLEDYIKSASIYDLKKLFNRYIYLKDGKTQAFYCDDDTVCDKRLKIIYCDTNDQNTNIYVGELKDEFSIKICSKEVK